jgi:hypothetical protein
MTQGSDHLHSSPEKKIRQGGLWPTSGPVRIRADDLVFEDLHGRSNREFVPILRGHGTVSHAFLSVLGEENANDRHVAQRQPAYFSRMLARTPSQAVTLLHQQSGETEHSNGKPQLAQSFYTFHPRTSRAVLRQPIPHVFRLCCAIKRYTIPWPNLAIVRAVRPMVDV